MSKGIGNLLTIIGWEVIGTPFPDIRTAFSYRQHVPLHYALFLLAYVHFSSHYTTLPLTSYIARPLLMLIAMFYNIDMGSPQGEVLTRGGI